MKTANSKTVALLWLITRLPKLPQRQDSLCDQLSDLVEVANRLGMYDAADFLRTVSETRK